MTLKQFDTYYLKGSSNLDISGINFIESMSLYFEHWCTNESVEFLYLDSWWQIYLIDGLINQNVFWESVYNFEQKVHDENTQSTAVWGHP